MRLNAVIVCHLGRNLVEKERKICKLFLKTFNLYVKLREKMDFFRFFDVKNRKN